ncbi:MULTISPECIES: DUF4249 domain-containing protein [Maribacter]|uniref:DUF4249 domain-containing protein n=1 Tax=Maribacter flavus TaxID=1658664 RepID=A0ABU7IGY6_9FLAO|nr:MULTISPECIES: DUF4249 domain-containing protein [Maribacter]MDC6404702.1 DUF4249 domain-containing protein [Maribacter sp. PR66]MEE1972116.1 DUF4249 domain-containing protein [Maribacter flavus]
MIPIRSLTFKSKFVNRIFFDFLVRPLAGILVFSFLPVGCVDPVPPEFDYEDGLIFIEGFASSNAGASYVGINESVTEFGVRGLEFITGASVNVENLDTGQTVSFIESEDAYLSPQDFKVAPGERWKLIVVMPNGTVYESEPEIVLTPVPITDVSIDYDPELEFRPSANRFIPGHKISVSFDDPPNSENNYYWSYRSFENLDYCIRCNEGIYRDGGCIPYDLSGRLYRYFDYICETECWTIRYPESVNIFDDTFSNGKTVANLEVGSLPLYTKENMVVEVQQFSLTPAAHKYYKVLKDIVDNASGFNAPPPAALIGNLYNANDSQEIVLGRFTAAASSVVNVYVERELINEAAIATRQPPAVSLEPTIGSPYPPPATNLAPCEESRYRTANEPEGWQ